jgi:Peptidase S24-like
MPVITDAREALKLDLAAEVLRSGRTIRLQALGTSMLPSIWPGDVLSIENKPGQDIVPGDIVLVAREGRFFVHRLIDKHHLLWITRGDSLPQNDEPVADVQVLGKVSLVHKRTGAVIPKPKLTRFSRTLARTLCHCGSLRNVVLRFHSFWQRRVPNPGNACVRRDAHVRAVEQRSAGLMSEPC